MRMAALHGLAGHSWGPRLERSCRRSTLLHLLLHPCSAYNQALMILGRPPINVEGLGDIDEATNTYIGLPQGPNRQRLDTLIRSDVLEQLFESEGVKLVSSWRCAAPRCAFATALAA